MESAQLAITGDAADSTTPNIATGKSWISDLMTTRSAAETDNSHSFECDCCSTLF